MKTLYQVTETWIKLFQILLVPNALVDDIYENLLSGALAVDELDPQGASPKITW